MRDAVWARRPVVGGLVCEMARRVAAEDALASPRRTLGTPRWGAPARVATVRRASPGDLSDVCNPLSREGLGGTWPCQTHVSSTPLLVGSGPADWKQRHDPGGHHSREHIGRIDSAMA